MLLSRASCVLDVEEDDHDRPRLDHFHDAPLLPEYNSEEEGEVGEEVVVKPSPGSSHKNQEIQEAKHRIALKTIHASAQRRRSSQYYR